MERVFEQKKLVEKINKSSKKAVIYKMIKELQQLRECGKSNSEIESTIKSLNLPLGFELFILGNFEVLMTLVF